ncbi:MAG: endonuclease/exonuclease/phosphatase family protein [Candidatus Flemingiibacterium sp.]
MTLRVATFNLKSTGLGFGVRSWKRRREILRDAMLELNADLVGVQELTPIMRTYLEHELGGYNFVGLGRGGPIFNEHSDIAVRNGIKIAFESTFPLSKNRSGRLISMRYPLSWIFPRICTVAELSVGGRRFRMFNTHLDVSSETARMLQLRIVCRRIAELNSKDPLPTILTGDFNATPDSRTVKLLESLDLPRLTSVADTVGGTFHFFRGKEPGMRLDHVFASPEFTEVSCEIVRHSWNGHYPSDHYPLLVTLNLGEPDETLQKGCDALDSKTG